MLDSASTEALVRRCLRSGAGIVAALGGLVLLVPEAGAVTVTYDNLSGSPFAYTENDVRHVAYHSGSAGSQGQWQTGAGPFIYGSAGCCIDFGRIDYIGSSFGLVSLERMQAGTSVWTAYDTSLATLGSVTIDGGSGTYIFPAAWSSGLHYVDVAFTAGSFGWDDLELSNFAPTIAGSGSYTTDEDTPIAAAFTVSDIEDSGSALTVTAVSSDTSVVANSGLSVSGSGSSRTLDINPVAEASGTTLITLTVTDSGGLSDTTAFVLTVNPVNDPPVAVISGGPYSDTEGVSITLDASASYDVDSSIFSYNWDCDGDGVLDIVTGAPTAACWYGDDGTFTVTLELLDSTWTSSLVVSTTVSISNLPPSVVITSAPFNTPEGSSVTVTAGGADPSPIDYQALTYEWTVTDPGGGSVATGSGTSVTFVPPDNGNFYIVEVTVTDPQGATGTDTTALAVSNAAPQAAISGPATVLRESAGAWTISGTDPSPVDSVALTIGWTITDGGGTTVLSGTDGSVSWTPTVDGPHTLTATVTDPQGAADVQTLTIDVQNAPPTAALSGPATLDEGSAGSWSLSGTDPNPSDQAALAFGWTVSDSGGTSVASGSGASVSWTPPDDGAYTITAVATDPQGASGMSTLGVAVANVAPTIDSTAPASADEGVLYVYQAAVTDPGDEVFTWSLSGSAPATMVIDAATGLLEWTPDYNEALVGSFTFVLTVDDGDGATDSQSWTVNVTLADDDADGLPDGWELANGLDPADPSDAFADPDADGLTNADELAEGQDPNAYDGPDAPSLVDPVGGAEVDTSSPDLLWDDAVDPQSDPLVYDVEVYADATLTTLVASVTGVAAGGAGQTEWAGDVPLAENTEHWWRARADDGWVAGPWSTEGSFVVNALNEAPEVPVPVAPIGGATAAVATPTLEWAEVADIDGDAVSYDVDVMDDAGDVVASGTGVVGDGLAAAWTVDVTLAEDTLHTWTVRAVDEHGLAGDWAASESFFLSTEDAAPTDTVFLSPEDGSVVATLTPLITASESSDPEGGDVVYRFELDSVATFDGPDYATTTETTPEWDLDLDGIELSENTTFFARVRAEDLAGIESATDTISFFVSAANDAPVVPMLSAPADGAEASATPTLVVNAPGDPEGDVVFIEFVVAQDEALQDVVLTEDGVVVTDTGTVSWTVPQRLEGAHWWTARAVDEQGAASDWATPWSFVAPGGETEPGCQCESSVVHGPAIGIWVLLPLVGLRRRRVIKRIW